MTSAIPGIIVYYWSSTDVQFFMPFLLLFIFQLGLVTLTLVRVVQGWWSAKGHLHAVLVKHNIFYYACGLCELGLLYLSVLVGDDNCFESSLSHECPCAVAVFRCTPIPVNMIDSLMFCTPSQHITPISKSMHLHLWHINWRDM
ncbi:hypothetical protein EDB19DRAFT_917738 [Suillus lakei]|nr:hypothetical protein EDB19DRAFT_917738 [Suillus lakei]